MVNRPFSNQFSDLNGNRFTFHHVISFYIKRNATKTVAFLFTIFFKKLLYLLNKIAFAGSHSQFTTHHSPLTYWLLVAGACRFTTSVSGFSIKMVCFNLTATVCSCLMAGAHCGIFSKASIRRSFRSSFPPLITLA